MKNYTKKETDKRGTCYYNEQGLLHRTDGPAVEFISGSKRWFINGKLHRTDGPACEWNDGTKSWYVNDKFHRLDGPAVKWRDGSKGWYVNGEELTEQEFISHPDVLKFKQMQELKKKLGI